MLDQVQRTEKAPDHKNTAPPEHRQNVKPVHKPNTKPEPNRYQSHQSSTNKTISASQYHNAAQAAMPRSHQCQHPTPPMPIDADFTTCAMRRPIATDDSHNLSTTDAMPPMPMQPHAPISLIGIPCGWMPIFDADCHPCLHPRHMQHAAPHASFQCNLNQHHFPGHHLPQYRSSEITEDWQYD